MSYKEKSGLSEKEIKFYRVICLLTVILLPLFAIIYWKIEEECNLFQIGAVIVYFASILSFSFFSDYLKKNFNIFMYAGFVIETVWGISLTYLNAFQVSYAIVLMMGVSIINLLFCFLNPCVP